MGKFVSLGEYNKLYKYLWMYLVIKFISVFIFSKELVFQPFKNDAIKTPFSPFIFYQFYYVGCIVFSAILIVYEKISKKKSEKDILFDKKLIYNKLDITTEFGLSHKDYFIYINLFLAVITDLLDEIIAAFQCSMFDYWVFEMLFFERFIARLFHTKIYKHHIFSLIFIICSCSIMQTIIIIIKFVNHTEEVIIFDNRKWLIPSAIIVFFLTNVFRAYVYNNEKYYLEKKNISFSQYLFIYGILGTAVSLFCAVLSTYNPCGDNSLPELSKILCQYKTNEDIYYFTNYTIFFKEFVSDYLGLRILFKIIDTALYYIFNYYRLAIYKKLNPIYHICMRRLDETMINLLILIDYFIYTDTYQGLYITISILNIILLIFFVSGSIVYLEFIELNFWDLNYNVKRKIKERSHIESVTEMDNISVNSDTSN